MVALAEKTRPYVAFGVKFFDYDNDGYLDLVIANGHVQDNIELIENAEWESSNSMYSLSLAANRLDSGGLESERKIVFGSAGSQG